MSTGGRCLTADVLLWGTFALTSVILVSVAEHAALEAMRVSDHAVHPNLCAESQPAGGGYGHTSRMWGMLLDHIVSATVVLADGSIVTASESENADLFWVYLHRLNM